MKSFVDDPNRRTVIYPKGERYGAFGGSLLLLPRGDLLYSLGRIDFEREVNQKVIIRSRDRGRTWDGPIVVDEQPGIPKTMRGDSLSLIDNDHLAMIGSIETSGFEIRFSSDGGRTWGEPIPAEGKGTVPWGNRIVHTRRGLLLTTRAPKLGESVRKVVMSSTSIDGGQTWAGPTLVAGEPGLKLTEPSTIRLRDGRLMTVARETSYNFYPSYATYSDDEGVTWSPLEEMPIHGHEICLGELRDGRVMVVYRHVGGYSAALAWAGFPDERPGYKVPATIRAKISPRILGGSLIIRTRGRGETVIYHLHPPESTESTIEIVADLRCPENLVNGCGIHVAQAGWIAFHPDRIELPDGDGLEVTLDASVFRKYSIVRTEKEMIVSEGDQELLRTGNLDRGRCVQVDYGTILPKNVNAFGTQSPFMADLEAESSGESHWRSLSMKISNPTRPDHFYSWDATSGDLPNQYEEGRMVEIENSWGESIYFLGQASWVQFPDGHIFVSTGIQYLRHDGRRSSWIRGCNLGEIDLPLESKNI